VVKAEGLRDACHAGTRKTKIEDRIWKRLGPNIMSSQTHKAKVDLLPGLNIQPVKLTLQNLCDESLKRSLDNRVHCNLLGQHRQKS